MRLDGSARAGIALFLVVLGARFCWIQRAGSDLPHWDQWFVDFGGIVLPQALGSFHFMDLARPQNEHRLLYPKLLTYLQMQLSGRWEPRDLLAVSAVTRALGLVAVFFTLERRQPRMVRAALLLLLAAIGGLPVGVFNLLSGFQLQFFIGEALMVLALASLCAGRLSVERVAAGGALLLLALLNMATPLITALAAGLTLILRALKGDDRRNNTLTAAFVLVFAGFTFWTAPGPVWLQLQARSVPEFLTVFVRESAWPFPDLPVLAVMALLPPLLLLRRLLRGDAPGEWSWFVLAVSLACLIQDAAVAYARAQAGGGFPQFRDGFWLRLVVGFLAWSEALRPGPGQSRALYARACAFWAIWVGASLVADTAFRGVPEVESVRTAVATRQPLLTRALQTGNFDVFESEFHGIVTAGSMAFFDHPSHRFAIPDTYIKALRDERVRLLPYMPAALADAPPSRVSQAIAAGVALGPVFLISGLLALTATLLGWKGEAVRAWPPAGAGDSPDRGSGAPKGGQNFEPEEGARP